MINTFKFDLDKELADCSSVDDLVGKNALVQKLVGTMLEKILEKEMDQHLGYEKHAVKGNGSGNSRNGSSKKTLKSSYGPIEISSPPR